MEHILQRHPPALDPRPGVRGCDYDDGEGDEADDGADDQQGDGDALPVALGRGGGHQFLETRENVLQLYYCLE